MQDFLKDLWIRIVVFNSAKNRVLLYREGNQYGFPRSKKAVLWGCAIKKQVGQIIKERFKVMGAEVGGLVFLGGHDCPGGIEIFIRVILKKPIELNHNYIWVDKYNIRDLNLDAVTREILKRIFEKK